MTSSVEHLDVMVTGANRGIGLSFVEALADRGAARILAAVRDPAAHGDLRVRFGSRLEVVALDLASSATIDAAAQAAGAVDLLILNAAQTLVGPFLEQTEAQHRQLYEVNLFGPLRLVRAMLPAMMPRRGGIIAILSMAALMPAITAEAYSATKAGMMMMMHAVRTATRDDGLRVSLVYPGFVDTPMSSDFDVKKASPRQIADRSIDGWLAGQTSIFPDVFAEMTRDALCEEMPRILAEPHALLAEMVDRFVVRADAGL